MRYQNGAEAGQNGAGGPPDVWIEQLRAAGCLRQVGIGLFELRPYDRHRTPDITPVFYYFE